MHFSVNTKTATRIRINGFYIREKMITLRFLPGDSYFYSPVVSKKQGISSRRNRIKRIIRDIMRAGRNVFPPGSYLVYYNGTSTNLDRNEISTNIDILMEIIKKRSVQ
jgi:ribonuclease P protein component